MSKPRWPTRDHQVVSPPSNSAEEAEVDAPVLFDLGRTAAALDSVSTLIPDGLSREEIRAFIAGAARS